jgi:small subunit ribosomal protein S24e|uniref:Small ribosomal subunit protein eS24 n=1 Tax=Thermofilum adornatum TaxID=1365176 RepID=A0A7C1G984_9CREN
MSVGSIKLVHERVNRVIGRRELLFTITHETTGTPSKKDIVSQLQSVLGTQGVIIVRKVSTRYGQRVSDVLVHVYDNEIVAKAFEPRYILKRNGLIQEEAKKEG